MTAIDSRKWNIYVRGRWGDGKWWPGTLSLLRGGFTIRKSFNFMSFPIKLILQDCYPFHRRLPAALLQVNLFHENPHLRPWSFFSKRRRNLFKLFFISFTRKKHRKCLIEFPLKRNKSKFIQFKLFRHSTFSARCLSRMHWSDVKRADAFLNCKFLFVCCFVLSAKTNIYNLFPEQTAKFALFNEYIT